MNKNEYKVSTYMGVIAEQFQDTVKDLYKAVYAKDKKQVELLFIDILETILKKYTTKPQKNDKAIQGDIRTLELLVADFDMDYTSYVYITKGDWLRDENVIYETADIPYELVSDPNGLLSLVAEVYHYLAYEKSEYSHVALIKALEEYKNARQITSLRK